MKIRRLEKEEHQVVRSLYEEVFSEDSTSFVDYYFTEKTKDNEIYVLEEDGAVRSMLHLNPYQIMVNGIEKTAHYIVAVATQENWRKRGYMKALIRKALKDMYRNGENFTFLMPAAEAIYLPHDFRTVYEQEKRYFHGEGEPLKIEEAGELAKLAESYLSAHYQVYAKRDAAYYERLVKEYASDGGRLMVIKKRWKNCRLSDRCAGFRAGRKGEAQNHGAYRRCEENADVIEAYKPDGGMFSDHRSCN